ncbi:MAG: hypothetical protein HZB65_00560 [Candidatus Aenigmarchaeota archaeon]|nr:hypothetical protein [Candidatus Aenigmarchaeota archaeon]
MDPIDLASRIVVDYKAQIFPPYTKNELYAKIKYFEEKYIYIDNWLEKWIKDNALCAGAGLTIREINEQKDSIKEAKRIIAQAIREYNMFVEPFQEERNINWLHNTETEPALRRIKGHIHTNMVAIFNSYKHFQGKDIVYPENYIIDILSETREQKRIKTTPDEYRAMDGKALSKIIQWGRALKTRIKRITNSYKANENVYESDPNKDRIAKELESFWNTFPCIVEFINFYNEKCPSITFGEMLKDKNICERIVNDPNFLDGNIDPISDWLNDYVMAYNTAAKRPYLLYYI